MIERLSSVLGLRNDTRTFLSFVDNSFLIKWLLFPLRLLHQQLLRIVSTSVTAAYISHIALGATLLLLFAAPFISSDLTAVFVLLVVGLTCIRFLLTDEPLPLNDLLIGTVLIFCALGLVSTGFSPYPKLSLYGYAKMLIYMAAYFCFLLNIRTLSHIRLAAWIIVLSTAIVSLYGLYQFHIKVEPLALWDDPESTYHLTRVYSFLGNPNLLGGYLLPTLSMTLFFYFGNLGWRKFFLLGAFVVQLGCLYFTYCRGAWLGFIAGAFLAFMACLIIFWRIFMQSRFFKFLLLLGVLGGVLAGIYLLTKSPAMMERVTSLFVGREHSSNSFRLNVWIASLKMIQDYWLTGMGMGNKVFVKIYTFYMIPGFRALSTYNVLLEIWVEMGLIGFSAFMLMMGTHMARCVWGIVKEIDYTSRLFLASALCAIVALGAHGMVDTVWFRPPIQILFWFLVATIPIVSRKEIAFNNTLAE